jgi:hypothetical protein
MIKKRLSCVCHAALYNTHAIRVFNHKIWTLDTCPNCKAQYAVLDVEGSQVKVPVERMEAAYA